MVPKGTFNYSTTYYPLDLVTYNNASYINKIACTGVYPTNTSYWQLCAAQGATGATGATGPQGPQGASASVQQLDVTIPASAWTGSAAPYTANVTTSGIPATPKGVIGLAWTATAAQYEAAAAAQITPNPSNWAANRVALVARGDKPTIDLPIAVTIY